MVASAFKEVQSAFEVFLLGRRQNDIGLVEFNAILDIKDALPDDGSEEPFSSQPLVLAQLPVYLLLDFPLELFDL